MLIDTHCHIHEDDYPHDAQEVLARAADAGVQSMICVGTSEQSSRRAVAFADQHEEVFAAIGVHPHESHGGWGEIAQLAHKKPVAIGEIGLDYYYNHSPRGVQHEALQSQIETALAYDVPIIFHVRDAFDDFWPIFDNFHGIRGVLHSFTDTAVQRDEALKRGLFIGVNGISTFTKDTAQQAMFASIPLERLLLETDAPFLTPIPLRGKVNEPAYVRHVAVFAAASRGVDFEHVARVTTENARQLFAI